MLHLIHIIADLYKKFQNNLFIFCTSNFFFHLGDWSQPVKAKTITVRDYTANQNNETQIQNIYVEGWVRGMRKIYEDQWQDYVKWK